MRRTIALAMAAAAFAGAAHAQEPRKFTVHFSENQATLSEQDRAILGVAIEMAQECMVAVVKLVGHDDTSQSDQRAQDVSMARADLVRKTMIDAGGINPESFAVEGRGKRQPLVPTPDGVKEKMNRRVEISVACK